MSLQMEGRVALITGGGSGFGRAAALRFAAEGARVAIGDLNKGTAEETAEAVGKAGAEALAAQVDVSDESSVKAFMAATLGRFRRLDCAFNNAGILGPKTALHTYPLADFERVMAVNVRGVWNCLQAEITQMLTQDVPAGSHAIVNTASVAGLIGSPLLPAYSASKHAVVGLTRSTARSYGKRGIRVNCLCPGPVDTPLAGPLFEDDDVREALASRSALGRFGTAEEVAELAVWLCSPASSMVTGTPIRVDAGALS